MLALGTLSQRATFWGCFQLARPSPTPTMPLQNLLQQAFQWSNPSPGPKAAQDLLRGKTRY